MIPYRNEQGLRDYRPSVYFGEPPRPRWPLLVALIVVIVIVVGGLR